MSLDHCVHAVLGGLRQTGKSLWILWILSSRHATLRTLPRGNTPWPAATLGENAHGAELCPPLATQR